MQKQAAPARVTRRLEDPGNEVRQEAEQGSGWYAWLARSGLVAKGISYGLVGALAFGVAVGAGGETTSRQGALQTLAQSTWGKIVLIVLALGFAAYAGWRFIQAFAERDEDGGEDGKLKKWGKRAGYIGRGVIYASLTYSTIKILLGSRAQQSQNQKAHRRPRWFSIGLRAAGSSGSPASASWGLDFGTPIAGSRRSSKTSGGRVG